MTSERSGFPDPPVELPEGRIVRVPGLGELFVRDTGGNGPPVLLIHGWMFPSDLNWFRVYKPLADAGYLSVVEVGPVRLACHEGREADFRRAHGVVEDQLVRLTERELGKRAPKAVDILPGEEKSRMPIAEEWQRGYLD